MDNEPEVRPVNAHPERDCRTDHLRSTLVEGILDTGAGRIGKACMVCSSRKPVIP